MLLYYRPLRGSETIGLQQNRGILVVDLPDIVQKCCRSNLLSLKGAKPEKASNMERVLLDASGMTRGIRIASLDRLYHQLEEFPIGLRQFQISGIELS